MPVRNDFQPGEFCWVDLASHDLAAATAWYGDLFGWQAAMQETPGGGPPYAFFLAGEAATAAVGEMNDDMKGQGVPPMWNSYVCVADCKAKEGLAAELGGTVTVPTMEVPGHGKLCFIMDNQGTSIALWEPLNQCTSVLVKEPVGLSWNEMMCKDVAAARSFYGAMFGWEFADMPMGDIHYTMVKLGDTDVAGMMAMDGPQFEGVPSHWAVYFEVADCDATAAKITETGGRLHIPPTEIPVGKFATAADPQGASFSVITCNPGHQG